MCRFPEETFNALGYYVYRLVDPRNGKTFYVGKGQGNRVFAHINDELKFAKKVDDEQYIEDEISAKMQTIREIRKARLKVKHVIHRYGMTEAEALEVEAALIDVYRELGELTNIQSGYESERGMIDTDDLIKNFSADEYDEPLDIDYVIIKTTNRVVEQSGSIYETTRKAWRLNLNRAKAYHYVLGSIAGIVKEVFEVEEWYSSKEPNRIEFHGHVAPEQIRSRFINKKLPIVYRKKGNANPVLYKKQPPDSLALARHLRVDEIEEYTEPDDIDYVIVKTKFKTVEDRGGSLYEASRKAWSLDINRVKNIQYVLATIDGIVREVYKVDYWYCSTENGKVEFAGKVAEDAVRRRFVLKRLPGVYRKQGNASSSLYKKKGHK